MANQPLLHYSRVHLHFFDCMFGLQNRQEDVQRFMYQLSAFYVV